MPTITRQQIKQVENGMRRRMGMDPSTLRGFQGLGQFDLLSSSATGAMKDLLDWITGRTGQLKITATEFVEGMVKVMYGTEPGCGMPTPGIQIVAGASPNRFCAGSIAGMVERCRLSDAQNSLDTVQRQFTERTQRTATGWIYPEGEFVKRWMDAHWNNDRSNLATAITTGRATCGVGGGPTITPAPIPGPGGSPTCPVNWKFNSEMNRCDYVLPGIQTGLSSTTMLMIAAVGLAFVFAMKR